jgi:hypothetical protein
MGKQKGQCTRKKKSLAQEASFIRGIAEMMKREIREDQYKLNFIIKACKRIERLAGKSKKSKPKKRG